PRLAGGSDLDSRPVGIDVKICAGFDRPGKGGKTAENKDHKRCFGFHALRLYQNQLPWQEKLLLFINYYFISGKHLSINAIQNLPTLYPRAPLIGKLSNLAATRLQIFHINHSRNRS